MDSSIEDLTGQYLHTYDRTGQIGYQAQIIGMDGPRAIIQAYSWRTGRPGDAWVLTRAALKKCKLYTDRALWRSTGEAEMQASKYWQRWYRPETKPVGGYVA
jgi:hypothetical protein